MLSSTSQYDSISLNISIITNSILCYFIYHFILFLYPIYQAVTCIQSLKLHFLHLLLSHLLNITSITRGAITLNL